MNKIKYKCKKCNWQTAILEAWGDLKPSFCGNKKCLSNFSRNPDNLEVVFPEQKVVEKVIVENKPKIDNKKFTEKKQEIIENN